MPRCLGINFVKFYRSLYTKVLKWEGMEQQEIEIEKGTTMHCWVPRKKKDKSKPALVLIHGFAGDGGITWHFQISAFCKAYAVYVPDLLFFGKSVTDRQERSEGLQAECIMKMLKTLGVQRCVVIGFSYGGMVAFKMAELYPEFVSCLVINSAITPMNQNTVQDSLDRLGSKNFAELLLPTTIKGTRALLSAGSYLKPPFPDCFYGDFLEVMFEHRRERAELLSAMVEDNRDAHAPKLNQKILLLWGAEDEIFSVEQVQRMKEELGDETELVLIKKAGHLVQLERPCKYNRTVLQFLKRNNSDEVALSSLA